MQICEWELIINAHFRPNALFFLIMRRKNRFQGYKEYETRKFPKIYQTHGFKVNSTSLLKRCDAIIRVISTHSCVHSSSYFMNQMLKRLMRLAFMYLYFINQCDWTVIDQYSITYNNRINRALKHTLTT